jgi:2-oxoacid:acceptor oxidoreductase gamma subunit (pyruvate/2-ketoisovalerate family)
MKTVTPNIDGLYEIRWHGRGGQGAVTAAKIVAYAAFLDGYRGVTSAPFFGAERRGMPVSASTRLSPEPILVISRVEAPDTVVILDETLLKYDEVLAGLKKGGWIIVNSRQHPTELGLPNNINAATADATGICKELGLVSSGIPVVNTAIIGAFARAIQLISMASLEKAIKDKFSNDSSEINIAAFAKTFKATKLFVAPQKARR